MALAKVAVTGIACFTNHWARFGVSAFYPSHANQGSSAVRMTVRGA